MSYVINSKLLDIDYRKGHIHALLDLHLKGGDIAKSPVVDWAHRTVARGDWWYGCEGKAGEDLEACIMRRQQDIIKLYCSLKEKGYTGSQIAVYFDKESGQVHTYDGYHRLSIMEYLGISADLNCVVSYHHPDPNQRGDFPLAERLRELNGGEYLYEPCEDPRVAAWRVWRPDSEARLQVVLGALVPGSVLDVGCGCGWFSRQLARAGFKVTSLEAYAKRLAVARYLSITQNLMVEHVLGKWQDLKDREFDNVLMLSVLHHDFLGCGPEGAFKNLEVLRGCCKRLVVEVPLTSESVVWLSPEKRKAWSFTLEEMCSRLEAAVGLVVQSVVFVHPARPIIVLEQGNAV